MTRTTAVLVGGGVLVLAALSCCVCSGLLSVANDESRFADPRPPVLPDTRGVVDAGAATPIGAGAETAAADPPPPSAHLASEVPNLESELASVEAYRTIWAEGHRDDVTVLLTGVSHLLTSGGLPRSVGRALTERRLRDAAIKLYMIQARIGTYPEAFSTQLGQFLDAIREQPHLGVWRAAAGEFPHDFAALAAWVRRGDVRYLREHIEARSVEGQGWTNYAANRELGSPWIDWLSLPSAAYDRLATTTRLTDAEWQRWCDLVGQQKVEVIDPRSGASRQSCGCPGGRSVMWAESRDRWPLTVRGGCLHCEIHERGGRRLESVTFRRRGRRYAVNGVAASEAENQPIEPIWADDPEHPGMSINIGGLISQGLLLCQ